ncbi:unnamed protein product [Sphagnum troendelagicum]
MYGVRQRAGHPQTRSNRSRGVHDRRSSRHHRHVTKPDRRAAPRGESSDERPIIVGTPDSLDQAGDSRGQR